MKKKVVILIVGICLLAIMYGCVNRGISNDKITIKQYKRLKVEKVEAEKVTDETVESKIQSQIQLLGPQVAIKNRPAQEGDFVFVDYVGMVDGVEFHEGTQKDAVLELGSKSFFIDGFEEGVIGHMPGDTFELSLVFPKTYENNPSLAEKTVIFTITLDGIVQELTEGLLPKLSQEAKTIEEYKQQIREELVISNDERAQSELEQRVCEALIEKCEVKEYPKDKIEKYTDEITSQFSQYASVYGMKVEEVVEQFYGVSLKQKVKEMICLEYAIELIAEKEKLTITTKNYEADLEKLVAQYNYDDLKEFEKAMGKEKLEKIILQRRVVEFLMSNCKQVKAAVVKD